ncbi:putative nucleotide-binding protein (sugar kinase/HSP70/actin superfamily) [Desulfohalotomaculum tongense]|uniref:acyl-CoA dehydratase activase-related protein n=1 Tax=Desulforadius tongensis TaxID=1216062 RepID=UPI001956B32A|nr:acyl-CoA dehydratase activase-related protein [Desulforadius tongensis]MBM7855467.1 putative nucleotide-binding protein (sugar kinase/HSP70/actin superfamily) [Desulforadius tongensis]
MAAKVGIPRTLFYYVYYPMIETFFKELGVETVTSHKTSRKILDDGVREALADACVPVKVFFGHVQALKGKVDFLFIPRVVCLNGKTIYCPKFLGLPDMIKHSLDGLPEVIDTRIDVRDERFAIWKAFYSIGRRFSNSKTKILVAYLKAKKTLKKYQKLMLEGLTPEEAMLALQHKKQRAPKTGSISLRFAVLGYPYIVHDNYISVNMLDKLKSLGVEVITLEQVPMRWINKAKLKIPKDMFWTFSDRVLKSSYHFFENGGVDGIIHLTAFGCGPDSMVDKYMELKSKEHPQIPFMSITIDEHSGEAGMFTRLEAFVDMVRRKKEAMADA